MRYGVYVPNFGPYGDARVLADLAYEAEEAGRLLSLGPGVEDNPDTGGRSYG